MAQNTYLGNGSEIWIMTDYGSLQLPYNPEKVAELVNAQFSIPPIAFAPIGPDDTRLSIGLPAGATQADIDAALLKLNAICADPTRNDLTADQQAAADLAAELAAIQTRIDAMAADIIVDAGDANAVPPTTGLKGTLQAANWNSLTDAQKIALLRTDMQAMINNQLDLLRAVRYLLRQVKQDKTGISTLSALR